MKTYRISFDLIVEEGHPRKWVPDAVWTNLNPGAGEDCDNWVFEEVEPVADSQVWSEP